MGLFAYLKDKFRKKDNSSDKDTKLYDEGLKKQRNELSIKMNDLAKKAKKVNSSYFEQLEEILIEADVGVNLTLSLIEETIECAKKKKIDEPKLINELLIDALLKRYYDDSFDNHDIAFRDDRCTVVLICGVNGVGKTTSIAKLGYRYQKQGKKVCFIAADTFRAAAVEQLEEFANRLNVPIVKGDNEEDPSSVIYRGLDYAISHGIDLALIDTSGRLHNKDYLMRELGKINRVIQKRIGTSADESFLVLDASTGQNGLEQAKSFLNTLPLTGLIVTKMDGTSKGGIILAINQEFHLPVRFIGLGEKMEDLTIFNLDKFLYSLLKEVE